MLSIKYLIDNPGRGAARALRRSVNMLLGGISVYASPYNASRLAEFQASIEAIRTRFERANNEESILELSASALRCVEEYSTEAEQFENSQIKQMRSTVAMLTDSLMLASQGTTEGVQNLTRVRTQLETISRLDNLSAINDRLGTCLDAIGEEVSRQNQQREQMLAELERAARVEAASPEVDSSTGLPGAKAGIRNIREMIGSGKSGRVLAFALDRMEAINQRFGVEVADQILKLFAQQAGQRMNVEDKLYRWRGPCFIATSQRAVPESVARAEASRIGARFEHMIEWGDREVSMAVSASWTVLPISLKSRAEVVLRKLDEFAEQRAHVKLD